MILPTLVLAVFMCHTNPVTQQDQCDYSIEQSWQGQQDLQGDKIDCLARLSGYPDVIGGTEQQLFGYAACMTVKPLNNRYAVLQNITDPDDYFTEQSGRIDSAVN